MDGLKIEYLPLSDIKPYKKNAKKHPKWQVEQIAKSIEEFGMNDPIAVYGPENEIVEGHGRLLACQELGYNEVPVIRLDYLTDEQRKAYCLVHNQLTLNSDFDLKILSEELDAIFDIDMSAFGFDVDNIKDEWEEQHQENKETERFNDANILQLERAQFPGVGKFDIPEIEPVTELPPIDEWIGFNYMLSEPHPERKAVHFFLNDYQFERIWNNPDRYIEKLSKFAAVASPEFSVYNDMPFALQLFNHYRKHWVGAYLQQNGVTVIPTITANCTEKSDEYYLEGEPQGGIVLMSSMWSGNDGTEDWIQKHYKRMMDELNPCKVIIYGKKLDWMTGDVERIPTFAEKRFGNA